MADGMRARLVSITAKATCAPNHHYGDPFPEPGPCGWCEKTAPLSVDALLADLANDEEAQAKELRRKAAWVTTYMGRRSLAMAVALEGLATRHRSWMSTP